MSKKVKIAVVGLALATISTGFIVGERSSPAVDNTQWLDPKGKPKLVVGIVVDQMRYDFLTRYKGRYKSGGLLRLIKEGHQCTNTQIDYVPTYTGPGHASIYTGTGPAHNGIVGNDWYDRTTGKDLYCVEDNKVKGVGSDVAGETGQRSPANLTSTTITDELRLASNKQGKVVGVCLKDRGSILPAGHMPTGSYWYDDKSGNFITSTFYASALPAWATEFNNKKLADKYLDKNWETVYPISTYTASTADDNAYEGKFKGETAPVFPHKLPEIKKQEGLGLIKSTPFGGQITWDFAKAAIEAEALGADDITDMLVVSFSQPDYIGHKFGPNSIEIEDTYLRLDALVEEMLNYLDKKVGKGNYTVFLTADHGVAHNPVFLKDQSSNIEAGHIDGRAMHQKVDEYMDASFPKGNDCKCGSWFTSYHNQQVYMNWDKIKASGVDSRIIYDSLIRFISKLEGIDEVLPLRGTEQIPTRNHDLQKKISNGFMPSRGGDLFINYKSGWIEAYGTSHTGTTHGSPYAYDTHIPLIWFGNGIAPGTTYREVYMKDIAPTLAQLLHIQEPSACTGKPIVEALK